MPKSRSVGGKPNFDVSVASQEEVDRIDQEAEELTSETLLRAEQERQERAMNPPSSETTWDCLFPTCKGTVRAILRRDTPSPVMYGPAGRSRGPYIAGYACDTCGVMHAYPPKNIADE